MVNLELSNLCHCVQHPWKLTSRHFWSSRNERKQLYKLKHVFWGNVVGYLRNGECKNFQTFAIVFSTPGKLTTRISGALGKKESHFLSKNVFWALRSEWEEMCHCVQYPWKLTSRDFLSFKNERKQLSNLKHVLRKCCGVSQKWWMPDLSNLCHCVQHPWKLTSRDFLSSRNEGKLLSKQKCVLTKCCGVSQKWWMLELSNLCHCVQHPWKLTSRDFLSSRNERKLLSKQKCVLRKCCGVSQKWWMLELSNLVPLCSAPLKTY